MGIHYRPEIDGLRAIAVGSVVLYHAGIGEAGFVGVDIFFVISGYLITALLLQEHAATGTIDLLAFYARRVRRIFPAAALVVLATLAAAPFVLEPDAQQQAARSAGAALAFVANVYFQFATGGYWDSAAEEMPLLHLWSLSVEEQFYFLWPALLLLVRSRKAMFALALASLGLAEFWIAQHSDAAFYQMPARFWELAVGGLVAARPARPMPRGTGVLALIVTLAACVYPTGHFPGVGALPAVLGAAGLLACVHGGGRNALLASKPMVAVGLISYSLYLWHWPLLAIYRANGGDSLEGRLVLCGIAVALAALSWRVVERPFRRMRFTARRTVLVGATASAVLALSACAVGLYDAPVSPTDQSREAIAERAARDGPSRACEYERGDTLPKCPDPAQATVTVWGDSQALAWGAAFDDAVVYSFAACAPMIGKQWTKGCEPFNDAVATRLRGDTVVLVARWMVYGTFDMRRTFEATRGIRRVVVIGPTPHLKARVPKCLRTHIPCTIPRFPFDQLAQAALERLRAQAKPYPNVEVVDVSDAFCLRTSCPPTIDGVALYYDTNHVSTTQARKVLAGMGLGRDAGRAVSAQAASR